MAEQPRLEDLPLHPDDPPYSAWGLFGASDELGTMNYLTPAVTKQAAEEIRSGVTVPLDLPLDGLIVSFNPTRIPLDHKIIAKGHANDDEITINTQTTSQWDSMRHFPYQTKPVVYFNGTLQDEISGPNRTNRNGIQNLAKHPFASRGVLVDWYDWKCSLGQADTIDPFSRYEIPIEEIKEVLEYQKVTLRQGDILLLRTGFFAKYFALSREEKIKVASQPPSYIGIPSNKATLEYFWPLKLAAVATDTIALEAWPKKPASENDGWNFLLHEIFLAGWGMPIGELFDLELLSRTAKQLNRFTFFFTSQPLMLDGGVGSPPNAMAIF
ncbi:uncharacterized protein V1516DRAFT_682134 [Lipomyces oligophaga]|uniref:uncharacterized protein n=1 Tax=Lipomyces oligophaga TaxID=45792 RepID=UPI0034CFB972